MVQPWSWAPRDFEGDAGCIVEESVAIDSRGWAASGPEDVFDRLLDRHARRASVTPSRTLSMTFTTRSSAAT